MKSSPHNSVLMVDDDEALLGVMSIKLRHSGYSVQTAAQASRGLEMATAHPYDALILDVTMPELSGIEVCQQLRSSGVLTPILMLSGNVEKSHIVQSLEMGADDYLTKPFSHTELVARLRALVRRNHKSFKARVLTKYGLELNVDSGIISFDSKTNNLTRKEVLLLKRLMSEAPVSVGRNVLFKDVWEINDLHTSNRLDVYIRRLRAKLDEMGATGMIQTVRGSGYLFAPRK